MVYLLKMVDLSHSYVSHNQRVSVPAPLHHGAGMISSWDFSKPPEESQHFLVGLIPYDLLRMLYIIITHYIYIHVVSHKLNEYICNNVCIYIYV